MCARFVSSFGTTTVFSSRTAPTTLGFLFYFFSEPFPQECTSVTENENMKKRRLGEELKEAREDSPLGVTSMHQRRRSRRSQRSAISPDTRPPGSRLLRVVLERRLALIGLSDLLSLNVASCGRRDYRCPANTAVCLLTCAAQPR